MGYIFDAMNRSAPDPGPDPGSGPGPGSGSGDDAKSKDLAPPKQAGEPLPFTAGHVSQPAMPAADPAPVLADADGEIEEDAPRTDAAPAPQHVLVVDTRPDGHLDDRVVALTRPGSVMAEEYRATRTSVLARWHNKRHLVHTITSATPQEGKTITTLNLGLIFSELRTRRTLVIEADLRLPTVSRLLNCEKRPGLSNYLRGDNELSDVICSVDGTALDVILAGNHANTEAVQLLSSQRMADLLVTMRQRYDHVLIDTPPVIELADAGILGAMSDDVLLIVRMNRTPRPLIEQAARILASYNAPVAGLIATDQRHARRRYYAYRYGYRYRYRYEHQRAA